MDEFHDADGAAPRRPADPPERLERERETARRYRERNADKIREYKRSWRERNAEHIRDYRAKYDEQHRDEVRRKNRERERERAARAKAEEERRAVKRENARRWYAENREQHLEAQRQYRAAQRENDPEGYRKSKRERNKRWRDKHKDEQNAKLREKYRLNPKAKRDQAASYYERNAEKVRARRREYYAANREAQLETQRRWREREKSRRRLPLPAPHRHPVPAAERRSNHSAANAFFARRYTPEQIAGIRERLGTSDQIIAKWHRDGLRSRAASEHSGSADYSAYFEREVKRRRRSVPSEGQIQRAERQMAEAEEEARMDAIAREINDRLRTQPRTRRHPAYDPSAPHAAPGSPRGGLGL